MSTQALNIDWTSLLIEAVEKPGLLLQAYSAFHRFSLLNQLVAIVQCGLRQLEPGPLDTYPGWKAKGRYVRKGEKAIQLCRPLACKSKTRTDENGDPLTFTKFAFKPYWFVLSQTEGDDLPAQEIPNWNRAQALKNLDIIEITFELTDGNTQGYAKRGTRSLAINPLAAMPHKTLFHELGHILLGHTAEAEFSDAETLPKSLREVEAEAVALLCCESLNLDGADYCRGYIQNWRQSEPIPEHSASRIFKAANEILKAGLPEGERADA